MRYDIQLLEDEIVFSTIRTDFTTVEQCQKFIDERFIKDDDDSSFSERFARIYVEKEDILKIILESRIELDEPFSGSLLDVTYREINALECATERTEYIKNIADYIEKAKRYITEED